MSLSLPTEAILSGEEPALIAAWDDLRQEVPRGLRAPAREADPQDEGGRR
jgi:hypothetical protein